MRPQGELPPLPAMVLRVLPPDGAIGFPCDAAVAMRVSTVLDPRSVGPDTFRVVDAHGPVPGRAAVAADGCVVLWRPRRPLRAGGMHFVVARGLRDEAARLLAPHCSRFVPGKSREGEDKLR